MRDAVVQRHELHDDPQPAGQLADRVEASREEEHGDDPEPVKDDEGVRVLLCGAVGGDRRGVGEPGQRRGERQQQRERAVEDPEGREDRGVGDTDHRHVHGHPGELRATRSRGVIGVATAVQ